MNSEMLNQWFADLERHTIRYDPAKSITNALKTSNALNTAVRIAPPRPSRILKSGNRTIVFWDDGTKTIVKRAEDEQDNDYAAFTAALGIKLYGSNSALKRIAERTEVQKPKKKQKEAASEEQKEELGKKLFGTMMDVAWMKWICPCCGREIPYEISKNGVIAVCHDCGVGTEIKSEM